MADQNEMIVDKPSATAVPIIELQNVSKRFGGTLALDDVNWSVSPGEIHCLIGENGSGKSTLIKLITGVHRPDAGSAILIDGKQYTHLSTPLAKDAGIQVIYQDLSLFPNFSVAENISIDRLIGQPFGFAGRKAMIATATKVLDRLQFSLPLDAIVGNLPVAERQIVAIARGLAVNARILFMDEPTASLTRQEVSRLFVLVRRLQEFGVAVVFVSHRIDEIVQIAERVSVLRDGKLIGTSDIDDVDNDTLTELITGDRVKHTVTAKPVGGLQPALKVISASRFGEFEDVSFTLHKGEVLGLIGLLGAGRTELALSLFGMTSLDRGELQLDGKALTLRSNRDAIGAGIAYVSEDRLTLGLNLNQSIADNISISVLDRIADWLGLVSDERRAKLAREWIGHLDIKAPNVAAGTHTLSGGNQQRIVLAKWLASDPKILILDSPTVGVDVRNKQGIYKIVRQLSEKGVAILLISDEVPEVYYNTDRVLHMKRGQIADEYVPPVDSIDELNDAIYA